MKIPCDLKSKGNKGLSDYFEQLCLSALACSNLITLEAGPDICDSCSLPPVNYMQRTLKETSPPVISPKRKSITEQETATSTTPSESPPVPSSSTGKIFFVSFREEIFNNFILIGNPSTPISTATGQQSPTSQNAQQPKVSPSEWNIEEVIQFIAATDPGLAVHADLFRKHVSFFVSFFYI